MILEDILPKKASIAGEKEEHTFDWEKTNKTISYLDA